ncbi:MAG: MFS transporter [Planctomycetes bacterium]|nr:MFS transporter [Planctomycetota bacterium]
MPSAAVGNTSGPSEAVPGAGRALALLLGINLFNYIDRQILSATLPKIKRDASIFRPDDAWINTKLGALTTAFMVAYMCLSPVFGRLGDKMSRWVIVGLAVILWSLATGGTGLATGYFLLFFARCLVGVGEAAYGPVAPAMLSDLYPVSRRGQVMAWFYMAIPVGSALGFVIGSQVANTSLGWRGAFWLATVPGLLLGALCFLMKEPPRPRPVQPTTPAPLPEGKGETEGVLSSSPFPSGRGAGGVGYFAVLKELRGIRSFVLCCAGMTASTFVLGGVATVMQLYVFEREARFTLDAKAVEKLRTEERFKRSDGTPMVSAEVIDKLARTIAPEAAEIGEMKTKRKTDALPLDQFQSLLKTVLTEDEYARYHGDILDACPAEGSATNASVGTFIGGIVVISGLVATLLGGILGDRLRNRGVRGAYFKVAGWGMIVAFPFFLGMLYAPFPVAWALLFVAVFFLFFNTGPANTILANVTRSEVRATAFAINILVIHALGDAISPLIIGFVSDLSSLQTAFVGVSLLIPVSGVLWLWGAKYLDDDTARAESAAPPPTVPGA